MSLLEQLSRPSAWEKFYEYKTSLACPKAFASELRRFIDGRGYLPICEAIRELLQNADSKPFPLPEKAVISKQGTQKKRTVYTYPYAENMVLKLLTHILLRSYDGVFCENLFSFRPGRSAKDAVRYLMKIPGIYQKYSYKVDVSNYFNSIPIPLLIPELEEALSEDPELLAFLKKLLEEPAVLDRGEPITEQKGIMAGTPLASFYANLYLADLDRKFSSQGIPYARYSDDIIVFADTPEKLWEYAGIIQDHLSAKGLSVNPSKEEFRDPADGFVFLGFSLSENAIDIAPATVKKLKQKMRRKARALKRWQKRNDLSGEKAAKAFIRIFNKKLLDSPLDNELSWSYWFFSVITTTRSLHDIDRYCQECIRYLVSDTRTKSRFNVRYETMKSLGYRSLVHAYYDFSE